MRRRQRARRAASYEAAAAGAKGSPTCEGGARCVCEVLVQARPAHSYVERQEVPAAGALHGAGREGHQQQVHGLYRRLAWDGDMVQT